MRTPIEIARDYIENRTHVGIALTRMADRLKGAK